MPNRYELKEQLDHILAITKRMPGVTPRASLWDGMSRLRLALIKSERLPLTWPTRSWAYYGDTQRLLAQVIATLEDDPNSRDWAITAIADLADQMERIVDDAKAWCKEHPA